MDSRRWPRSLVFGSLLLLITVSALAQGVADPKKRSGEFEVPGAQHWIDTGIDIKAGETVRIAATGSIRYATGANEIGPEGRRRGWRELFKSLPLNDANIGALLGRIGDDKDSRPFLVGPNGQNCAAVSGRLFLAINHAAGDKPSGGFKVTVEIIASPAPAASSMPVRLPEFSQEMLDSIPLRVVDAAGTAGDRSNFVILGSEQQVKQALADAGWVQVNRTVKDAAIGAALATFSRQAYTQLPMSELFVFGWPQNFGYAQGDPLVVVAARHHFRLWKAPFQADRQTVWVGAGTHDIGFDRDQRGGITHKIDPDVDKERDFIGASLEKTGVVARMQYMTPANPVKEAKTAHGEAYHSDGRTLVIYFKPDVDDLSKKFAATFCTVLRESNPDGGEWGDCSKYIELGGSDRVELTPIPDKYRLLIVPGLMNTCFSSAPAYKEGQEYLRTKHGLTVELLPLPDESSEDNAKKIAEYIREQMKQDNRKYIVLGYSKGTPDLQVALASEPGLAASVAAFINVAGASGGSPVADVIAGQADLWMRQFSLPNCKGDLSKGFKSLSQQVRSAFLVAHPDPVVPTYSLPTISDRDNTSKMLLQTWQLLAAFGEKQDSQLTHSDQIIPGSKYLGLALADHFAVALPFETSNESVKSGADKNHYPRTALLEAALRVVIRDLEAK